MKLSGKNVAILIAPRGTEEPEFTAPRNAVEAAGAAVTVLSLKPGEAKTSRHDLEPGETHRVDKSIEDVSADDFDGLIVPGGCVGSDR